MHAYAYYTYVKDQGNGCTATPEGLSARGSPRGPRRGRREGPEIHLAHDLTQEGLDEITYARQREAIYNQFIVAGRRVEHALGAKRSLEGPVSASETTFSMPAGQSERRKGV